MRECHEEFVCTSASMRAARSDRIRMGGTISKSDKGKGEGYRRMAASLLMRSPVLALSPPVDPCVILPKRVEGTAPTSTGPRFSRRAARARAASDRFGVKPFCSALRVKRGARRGVLPDEGARMDDSAAGEGAGAQTAATDEGPICSSSAGRDRLVPSEDGGGGRLSIAKMDC